MVRSCMRGVYDRGWDALRSRSRTTRCCLPRPSKRVGPTEEDFAADWPACTYPCQRFAHLLADIGA